jgi:hypothetical protein
MNRRQFLTATSITGAAVIIGGSATWFSIDDHAAPLTIDNSLAIIHSFETAQLSSIGEWNLYQIFTHCAQSVEYSMTGYPEHKSELFKKTAGALAFSTFSKKGKMSHSLNEAIPGAPPITTEGDYQEALKRFKQSLSEFKQYRGNLMPHFAYGDLSKEEYEKAHVMHFNNHLLELQLKTV